MIWSSILANLPQWIKQQNNVCFFCDKPAGTAVFKFRAMDERGNRQTYERKICEKCADFIDKQQMKTDDEKDE